MCEQVWNKLCVRSDTRMGLVRIRLLLTRPVSVGFLHNVPLALGASSPKMSHASSAISRVILLAHALNLNKSFQ